MGNKIDVVLGIAVGDEGKGKIVDILSEQYDVVARFNGGDNSGHVVVVNGVKKVLHLIPSGALHKDKILILGNGVVINPISLKEEIEDLEKIGLDIKNRLYISDKAHLITPAHRMLDEQIELMKGKNKIGSTKKGIGPTYTDKAARLGIKVEDIVHGKVTEKYQKLLNAHSNILTDKLKCTLKDFENDWIESIEYLSKLNIVETEYFIDELLKSGKKILAEGAQGTLLDVDFGTYPFVTSSNTVAGGVCIGLGVSPTKIGKIYGITKAYVTRVGNGHFATELNDEIGEKLAYIGKEYGSTTGRKRRCGWLDMVSLKYSCMINGVDSLIVTKLDVLDDFDTIKICDHYEINGVKEYKFKNIDNILPQYINFNGWKTDTTIIKNYIELPENFKNYINYIEECTGVKVEFLSTGPERSNIIIK